jgi:hypothetical protein
MKPSFTDLTDFRPPAGRSRALLRASLAALWLFAALPAAASAKASVPDRPPATQEIRDIRSLAPPPLFPAGLLLALSASLLAAGLAIGRGLGKGGGKTGQASAAGAAGALAALRAALPGTPAASRDWYARLSGLLKGCGEWACGIRAAAMTREEFCAALRETGALSEAQLEEMDRLLARAERVRFAGQNPSPGQIAADLEALERLVETMRERASR